jgi:hypothetical protein
MTVSREILGQLFDDVIAGPVVADENFCHSRSQLLDEAVA